MTNSHSKPKDLIIKAIESLDWSQAEHGYTPSDEEYVEVLLPIIESQRTEAQLQLLDELERNKHSFTWTREGRGIIILDDFITNKRQELTETGDKNG